MAVIKQEGDITEILCDLDDVRLAGTYAWGKGGGRHCWFRGSDVDSSQRPFEVCVEVVSEVVYLMLVELVIPPVPTALDVMKGCVGNKIRYMS